MAYVLRSRNICFIHIPKTSGTWVKRVLGEIEHGNRDGSLTHDLPCRWDYDLIFTVVREPAEWLASVWGQRMREKWAHYQERIPWQYLCQYTDIYRGLMWENWISRVTDELPGVVNWFYGIYTPPGVTVIRKEYDLYEFLYSLGGSPWRHEPTNVGYKRPVITEEIRDKIRKSEAAAYRRYGYL